MQISWHGLGCFRLSGKPNGQEVTVVTDPYQNSVGLRFPRSLTASMTLVSHDAPGANNIEAIGGENEVPSFVVTYPGEYEVKGVFATGVAAARSDGEHTIYRIDFEDMTVGFLGALDRTLTDDELSTLGSIDILLIPMGGGDVLGKTQAADLVAEIEPRLVIPSYYHVDGLKEKREGVEAFCKELGCPREDVSKLKMTKNALPVEGLRLIT